MIDGGDPRVGAPKLRSSDTAWRWTVIRQAAPEQRNTGAKRSSAIFQRRIRVRCVCGATDTVWEKDVTTGRSRGCRSKACRVRHAEEVGMQVARATIEAIQEQIAKTEATIADLAIKDAEAKANTAARGAELDEARAAESLVVAELDAAISNRATLMKTIELVRATG